MRTIISRLSFADCVTRAAAQCGLKGEAIAAAMGISPAQFSRGLHGQEHFHLDRLLVAAERDPDLAAFYFALQDELAIALKFERRSPAALLRQALALLTDTERRTA